MTLIFETARKISPRYQVVQYHVGNGAEIAEWVNSMSHCGAWVIGGHLVINGLNISRKTIRVLLGSYILLNEDTGYFDVMSEAQYKKQFTNEVDDVFKKAKV